MPLLQEQKVVIYDELIGENGEVNEDCNRFDLVAKLEAMTPDERFAFGKTNFQNASVATHAEMFALPAHVKMCV